MRKLIVPLIVGLLLQSAASAGGLDNDEAFNACLDNSNGVTVNITDCQQQYLERLEKKVVAKVDFITGGMDEVDRADFIGEQKQWETWRKNHCDFSNRQGTIQAINAMSCYLQATQDRLDLLNNQKLESNSDVSVCLRRAGSSLSLEVVCFQEEYQRADTKLNAVWNELKSKGKVNNSLIAKQRRWVDYRDKNCGAPTLSTFDASSEYFGCLTKETDKRTAELSEELKN